MTRRLMPFKLSFFCGAIIFRSLFIIAKNFKLRTSCSCICYIVSSYPWGFLRFFLYFYKIICILTFWNKEFSWFAYVRWFTIIMTCNIILRPRNNFLGFLYQWYIISGMGSNLINMAIRWLVIWLSGNFISFDTPFILTFLRWIDHFLQRNLILPFFWNRNTLR